MILLSLILQSSCSSQPIKPESKNIEVSRENPGKDCTDLGPVQGAVSTASGTFEQALEDLKLDAARKGATFVRIESASALGSSVRGTAFQCR